MRRLSSHGRAEWLIATSRVILAAYSLLADRLDPSASARFPQIADSLISVYLIYSVALFALLGLLRNLPQWWKLATHVFDVTVFMVLVYVTEGPNSPFFVYFTFALACAAVRWQWLGTLLTAAVAIPAYPAYRLLWRCGRQTRSGRSNHPHPDQTAPCTSGTR